MKWFVIVGLVIGVIGALSLVGTSEGGVPPDPHRGIPKDPYIGAWESVDLDGSYQRLMIGGGPKMSIPPDPLKPPHPYHIVYFDHGATVCGGSQAIAIGYGMDVVMGETHELVAELSARCLKSGEALDGWMPMFVYMPDGDMLMQPAGDGMVIFWKRQGQDVGHPHMPSR
jgi:hypothetical protein